MSTGILNVGRLNRKFIYESADSPNEVKLRYNDPSFVTFRILFDFEPIVSNDEVMQGLLLNEFRDESAISYLRRMGELERAEALKEFVWLLSKTANDFPWFFKSISGLDGLWKWGYTDNFQEQKTMSSPVDLTVSCFETVDFRMTALADLYRKATRDRRYFRDLLTLDKRRFNMTIVMGEARNLKTFVETNRTDWLNHVSAVAFRCLDCEFDFSGTMPNSLDASEAPAQLTPSFNIKVNRVQEVNSYLLLNYMLGEMKRDLIIKEGGSGAGVNSDSDLINYRALLSPFIRTYENNYNQVLADFERNKQQNFINQITLRSPDRNAALSYSDKQRLVANDLNGISKENEFRAESTSILNAVERSISDNSIRFGVPSVNTEIENEVNLMPPTSNMDGTKITDDVANQIEFNRPKVETSLPDFTLTKPTVAVELQDEINLNKPTVQNELTNEIGLIRPSVNDDQGNLIDLISPTVENKLANEIDQLAPTVQQDIDTGIDQLAPTVNTSIDDSIVFGRPTVIEAVDARIDFVKPSVTETITEKLTFEKPKVEDDFGS